MVNLINNIFDIILFGLLLVTFGYKKILFCFSIISFFLNINKYTISFLINNVLNLVFGMKLMILANFLALVYILILKRSFISDLHDFFIEFIRFKKNVESNDHGQYNETIIKISNKMELILDWCNYFKEKYKEVKNYIDDNVENIKNKYGDTIKYISDNINKIRNKANEFFKDMFLKFKNSYPIIDDSYNKFKENFDLSEYNYLNNDLKKNINNAYIDKKFDDVNDIKSLTDMLREVNDLLENKNKKNDNSDKNMDNNKNDDKFDMNNMFNMLETIKKFNTQENNPKLDNLENIMSLSKKMQNSFGNLEKDNLLENMKNLGDLFDLSKINDNPKNIRKKKKKKEKYKLLRKIKKMNKPNK